MLQVESDHGHGRINDEQGELDCETRLIAAARTSIFMASGCDTANGTDILYIQHWISANKVYPKPHETEDRINPFEQYQYRA